MKLLSVRQPWAWAILHGGKDIENRAWATDYRGPLAIHASKKFDFTGVEFEELLMGRYGGTMETMAQIFESGRNKNDVRGAVIGVVDLVDCAPSLECDWSPWQLHGPRWYCWKLANPRVFERPYLVKGQLGLVAAPERVRVAALRFDAEAHGLTGEEFDLMAHSLGSSHESRLGWRNHFCAGSEDFPTFDSLVARGWMIKGRDQNRGDRFYHVSQKGKDFFGVRPEDER